jgi:hypothetical protein
LYLLLAEAENGLHNRHFDVDDYKAVVIDGMEQDKKVVEQVKNFLAMRKIHSELFYNIRMWGVRDPEFNKQKFSADLIEQFNAIKDEMKFDKAKQTLFTTQQHLTDVNSLCFQFFNSLVLMGNYEIK